MRKVRLSFIILLFCIGIVICVEQSSAVDEDNKPDSENNATNEDDAAVDPENAPKVELGTERTLTIESSGDAEGADNTTNVNNSTAQQMTKETARVESTADHENATESGEDIGLGRDDVAQSREATKRIMQNIARKKGEVMQAYGKLQSEGYNGMINLAKKMAGSNMLGKDKAGIKEKFGQLRKKANQAMKPIDLGGSLEKAEGNVENLATGITAVATGFTAMKEAYESGNWLDLTIAGIDMVSSFASLAGPKGAIVAQILGVFSTILGLFQESPKEESQEDMMKRVLQESLNEFQEESILFRANGYVRAFSILSKSIDRFREKGEKPADNVASELYNRAFDGLEMFGEIENMMEKWCVFKMVEVGEYKKLDKDKGNSQKDKDKWLDARSKLTDRGDRCLKLTNVYCQLSVLRQMMLASMAGLMSDSPGCKSCESLQFNLLDTIRAEQETDVSVLRFFADPVRDWRKRYGVSYYFANTEQYPVIVAYLNKLDKSTDGGIYGDGLLICNRKELMENCLQLHYKDKENEDSVEGSKKLNLFGWSTPLSVFVPNNYQIYNDEPGKHSQTIFGPNVVNIDESWSKIYMKPVESSSLKGVRICASAFLASSTRCRIIMEGSIGLDPKMVISSMSIPRGVQVVGKGNGRTWGPFVGPQIINSVCDKEKWQTVDVSKTTKSSTNMIKICSREMFREYCEYVEESTTLRNLHGCSDNWWRAHIGNGQYKMKFKSMVVPNGVQIKLFDTNNYQGKLVGSYIGPMKLNDVDSYPQYGSMKVISLVKGQEGSDKVPFL